MENEMNPGATEGKISDGALNVAPKPKKDLGKPKKKLWLILAAAIIVLAAAGAGAWYYFDNKNNETTTDKTVAETASNNTTDSTETPATSTTADDETVGWKTYTNTEYGFNFKYPTDWTFTEDSSDFSDGTRHIIDFNGTPFRARATVYNATDATPEKFVTRFFANVEAGPTAIINTTISGLAATKYIIKVENDYGGYEVAFKNTNAAIVFSTNLRRGSDSEIMNDDVINKMISTFQFTDPTASWKTYTNSAYGYSVKYPTNWSFVPDDDGAGFGENGKTYYGEGAETSAISVGFYPNERNETLLDFANRIKGDIGTPAVTELTIGGQKAVQLTNYLAARTFFAKGDQIYFVSKPNFSGETESAVMDVYTKMYPTFQFTE